MFCFNGKWSNQKNFTSKHGNIEQIKIQQMKMITTVTENLAKCNKDVQKNYKLSGVYVSKRILKDHVFHLYPKKHRNFLNGQFEEIISNLPEKVKDLCKDCDPHAVIGCYNQKFGFKKTNLILSTMLFDEYCVNTINEVQSNEVEIDTVTQIYHDNELSKFEELLEYRFLNPLYLIRAVTHPSHELFAKIGSNLELAFIGDPVLDELLLRDFQQRGFSNEQFEKCRQSILCNEHLGILAIRYGFDKYRLIRPGAAMCKKSNAGFFEAVIGAVYLDAGKNMQVAFDVSTKFLKPSKKDFLKSINLK